MTAAEDRMRDFFRGSASSAWVAGGLLPAGRGPDSSTTDESPSVVAYRYALFTHITVNMRLDGRFHAGSRHHNLGLL